MKSVNNRKSRTLLFFMASIPMIAYGQHGAGNGIYLANIFFPFSKAPAVQRKLVECNYYGKNYNGKIRLNNQGQIEMSYNVIKLVQAGNSSYGQGAIYKEQVLSTRNFLFDLKLTQLTPSSVVYLDVKKGNQEIFTVMTDLSNPKGKGAEATLGEQEKSDLNWTIEAKASSVLIDRFGYEVLGIPSPIEGIVCWDISKLPSRN